MSSDPFDLERFVEAQSGGVYEQVVAELSAGRKTSHWMWFVFPQLEGLGRSTTARRYAISGLEEAQAYLHHSLLGARLHECADLVLEARRASVEEIFGPVDTLKLRSCMTLFLRAAGATSSFGAVLDRWFEGVADSATERMLGDGGSNVRR